MENWTVCAFNWIDGKQKTMAWGTGLNHKGAKALYELYYDQGYAMVQMQKESN